MYLDLINDHKNEYKYNKMIKLKIHKQIYKLNIIILQFNRIIQLQNLKKNRIENLCAKFDFVFKQFKGEGIICYKKMINNCHIMLLINHIILIMISGGH